MKTFKKLAVSVFAFLLVFTVVSGVFADEIEGVQSAILINRVYSTYSQTSAAGQKLRYGMNCLIRN